MVPQDDRAVLPADHEVALEVRSGELSTLIDGDRQIRRPGNMWLLPAGSRMAMRVVGEVAVLRAIYLIPQAR